MEAFLATILLWAANYAPKNWMFCWGQTLPINQNTALFALLGTTFGGDGVSVFKLPDFRGRVPVGVGPNPGNSTYVLGQVGGSESVTLTINNMPAHNHPFSLSVVVKASNTQA